MSELVRPVPVQRRIAIRTRCLDCDQWHIHEYGIPVDAEIPDWLLPLLYVYRADREVKK